MVIERKKYMQQLLDSRHNGLVKIITGVRRCGKFLSKDIITEFRGRGYQVHVSPLSFAEFMTVYPGSKENGWVEYLQYGGLPPVVLQPTDEAKIKVLKDLWQETYLIDILNRNRIKNDTELQELLCMLASGIGGLINPQKLSNTFKTNKNVSLRIASTRGLRHIVFEMTKCCIKMRVL